MDDKEKAPNSLGLDDIAPAAKQKGPGLGSGDFSPKSNGGPAMDSSDEKPAPAPSAPFTSKAKAPPLGLVAMLLATGALVISLWALWTTPSAMIMADGANMQPIQAQLEKLSNRISEFEVSPLGPPDKKSHTASISLLRRKVVSLSAKIDALEQEQERLLRAQTTEKKAAEKNKRSQQLEAATQTTPAIPLAQKTAEAAKTPTPQPTKAAKSSTKKITHKVRSGQTLSLISRRYNVSIPAIKRWNGLRNNNIKVGQNLIIYVKR